MKCRDFLSFLLSTPLAAVIDYEKLFWVKEKTIFLTAIAPVEFNYDIVIPSHWSSGIGRQIIDTINDTEVKYRLINRAEAIKRGILIKGQGLEDIDMYIRNMQKLK